MTSPSDPLDEYIAGPTIREWIGPDGEEWVALAPHVLAASEQLRAEGVEEPTLPRVRDWLKARIDGREPFPDSFWKGIFAIDKLQRRNGYAGV